MTLYTSEMNPSMVRSVVRNARGGVFVAVASKDDTHYASLTKQSALELLICRDEPSGGALTVVHGFELITNQHGALFIDHE